MKSSKSILGMDWGGLCGKTLLLYHHHQDKERTIDPKQPCHKDQNPKLTEEPFGQGEKRKDLEMALLCARLPLL